MAVIYHSIQEQQRIDNLVFKLLQQREGYIIKYIDSLETSGIADNFEAMTIWNVIRDLDTHVKNLQTLAQPAGV
jgi:hypothetical protein